MGSATELTPDSSALAPAAAGDNCDLPVRVRQASLAPQLREQHGAGAERPETSAAPAEAVRSTMSAMQRGWERGRSVGAQSPEQPAGPDAGAPEHRGNHEEA